jgi:predicted dehydrogenase
VSALRVGVFGLRRGLTLAGVFRRIGASVVAVADADGTRREQARAALHPVTVYEHFDDLLAHDLDAIVVANYFDEHARFAIAALAEGRHVLSETAACRTPAEAVALHRAAAASSAQYMLGENYPYLPNAQALRRLYASGVLGEVEYAESEYLHSLAPMEPGYVWAGDAPSHWRAQISSTAYCTHSIAPPLFITGRRPVSVIAPVRSPSRFPIGRQPEKA